MPPLQFRFFFSFPVQWGNSIDELPEDSTPLEAFKRKKTNAYSVLVFRPVQESCYHLNTHRYVLESTTPACSTLPFEINKKLYHLDLFTSVECAANTSPFLSCLFLFRYYDPVTWLNQHPWIELSNHCFCSIFGPFLCAAFLMRIFSAICYLIHVLNKGASHINSVDMIVLVYSVIWYLFTDRVWKQLVIPLDYKVTISRLHLAVHSRNCAERSCYSTCQLWVFCTLEVPIRETSFPLFAS